MAPWVNGVKTGHTFGARYVLVGSGRRKGVELIAAVVGTETDEERFDDTLQLLEYGFSKYRKRVPIHAGQALADAVDPLHGRRAAAARGADRGGRPAAWAAAERSRCGRRDEVEGPIRRGARLGTAVVRVDGLRAASVPLLAGRAVPKASTLDRVRSFLAGQPALDRPGAVGDTDRSSSLRRRRTAMILTVTLNAAIDRTVAVPNFRLGHRHRAVESRTVAGGKGINVARALRLLGRPVIATGFAGGPTGNRMLEQLRREAILTDFTWIAGETRINMAVIDPTSGEQTEINERGPAVSPEEVERFVERLRYLADGAKICVLAGTLPPGAGAELYARLVEDLRECGVKSILDSEGEAMLAGLRAGASVVTPNEREAEELVGQEFSDGDDFVQGLSELVRLGAGEAAITRPDGCVAVVGEGAERRVLEVRTKPLEAVSTVGSGDAFLAGYAAGLYDGREPEECLAYGVACGAESTQHFGAGTVDRRRVERLLDEVEVRDLEVHAEV